MQHYPLPLEGVRGFLLDMDGTITLGEKLLPGALRFLEILDSQRKKYIFLTNNSSKNRHSYAEKLHRLGMDVPAQKILTSGEAATRYVTEKHPGSRIHVAGTPDLCDEFVQAGCILDDVHPNVVVLGYDTALTFTSLWRLCDHVRLGLPYIATHPDLNCPTESGMKPDVGAVIAYVKASTGREPDLIIGKPNRWIVESAASKLELSSSDLAVVGDRLYTDIAMGETCGLQTVLVLSGETRMEDVKKSNFSPGYIFKDIAAVGDWLAKFEGQDADIHAEREK